MRWLIDRYLASPVAANLTMLFVIAAGLLAVAGSRQEVFPDIAPDLVTVSVAWPGATPEEVEEGVAVKVEEAIDGTEGVKRIRSTSVENLGTVVAEIDPEADKETVLEDIRTRVGALSNLPDGTEKPVVADVEMPKLVLDLMVSGDLEEAELKRTAETIRDELALLPEVSRVEVANARDYEISVEVSEAALRRYGLNFDEVVAAVRQSSLNLGGGTLKARGGEITLRTSAQAYRGRDFERIVLLRRPDGTRIRLGDVAEVRDGLEEVEQWSTFDGKPSLTIKVFRAGSQSVPDVAGAVEDYVARKAAELPPEVKLTIGTNWADRLDERLGLMLSSGAFGLALILVTLTLFLRFRLAFWVAAGIPVAMLGTIWLLPWLGTSINMMSLFGFVLVLGILVDDGIVVAENIHWHRVAGLGGREAARAGVHEVATPVFLSSATTVAAFIPMLMLPGVMGQFARDIPIVVIAALAFSLVEALLILPRHLSHLPREVPDRERGAISRAWNRLATSFSRGLEAVADRFYRPLLSVAVRWRYTTLVASGAAILLAAYLFVAGHVKFDFFPPIAGDQVVVSVTMPPGTAVARTEEVVARVLGEVDELGRRYERDRPGGIIRHVRTSVGARPQDAENAWETGGLTDRGPHLAEVFVELAPPEERGNVAAEAVMRELRDAVGDVPDVKEIRFDVAISGLGAPIDVELRAEDLGVLRAAADRLSAVLRDLPGVHDVTDDLVTGRRELLVDTTPAADALGITRAELARQVRQGFYGDEAQRVQRGRDEVKVMVRYPEEGRRTLADLRDMRIRLPDGAEVPFSSVATVSRNRGPVAIHRAGGVRTVRVRADVDPAKANANEVLADLGRGVIPKMKAEFPGLAVSYEGKQREQADTLGGLASGSVLAVLLIYTILALAFGSFSQPFIVLTALPFGMVGAIVGHFLMGRDLTMLSSVGLLAMAGVVVNDSMILVDYVNRARERGASLHDALLDAGPRRFRAVVLTSMTTFAGLAPLLVDTSVGAQFLIPMAISLAFGVMFATAVTLLLVPALYGILEDLTGRRVRLPAAPAPIRRYERTGGVA